MVPADENVAIAMCNRLGDSIVAHNLSCIDPWYGPRTNRTIEFLSHTVVIKSTEHFCLLLPVICIHYSILFCILESKMDVSFVEKSPLVVKFMAFYKWWGMNMGDAWCFDPLLSNSSISCNDSIPKGNLQQPNTVILIQCASQKTVLSNSPLFEYSYDFQ